MSSTAALIGNLVESKGLMAAMIAGAGGMFGLGMQWREALQFGAVACLGVSLGDTMLTASGQNTKIKAYFTSESLLTYMDPMDGVAGLLGGGLVNFSIGLEGRELLIAAAICGVAGAVAPKLSGYINSLVSPATKAMTESGGTGAAGSAPV